MAVLGRRSVADCAICIAQGPVPIPRGHATGANRFLGVNHRRSWSPYARTVEAALRAIILRAVILVAACGGADPVEFDCDLQLVPVATIADSGNIGPSLSSSVILHKGRFYVAPTFNPYEIAVYDSVGALLHSFGRAGDGPGEIRDARKIHVAGDTLFVNDTETSRISKFTSDGQYIGIATSIRGSTPFGVLRDGGYAVVRNANSDEEPANVDILRGDDVTGQFVYDVVTMAPSKRYLLIESPDSGHAWIASRLANRIGHYSYAGERVAEVTLRDEWFVNEDMLGRRQIPDSTTTLIDFAIDSAGAVRTLMWTQAEQPAGGPERPASETVERRAGRVVIEITDPQTQRVIGRFAENPSYLAGFADPYHVYARDESAEGAPVLKVFRLQLEERDSGAVCR
jgi:hypothetical protein